MSKPSLQRASDDDIRWAFDALEDVSRTFALSISMLDEPFSTWVCTGYLLCRVADTVEDAPHIPPKQQVEVLHTYDEALDPESERTVEDFQDEVAAWVPDRESADWDVVQQAERVFRIFDSFDEGVQNAMRPVVSEMTNGMTEFIDEYAAAGGLRIQSIEELEDYCWYVAGTVGVMITNLVEYQFDVDVDPLREEEESFALLLQLVNIAKDVPDDYQTENNVYLPSEWLAEADVSPEAVTDTQNTPAVAGVVERVVGHARSYTSGAYRYLMELPTTQSNVLEAFTIPYLLALGTLRELEANTEHAVETEDAVKVSREEVFALLEQVRNDFSKEELKQLRTEIRSHPLHEANL
jgi:farnesyl-diphosphate farnesyltransferase